MDGVLTPHFPSFFLSARFEPSNHAPTLTNKRLTRTASIRRSSASQFLSFSCCGVLCFGGRFQDLLFPTAHGPRPDRRTIPYGHVRHRHRRPPLRRTKGCANARAMARWGQGDPRWLVQHRDDGTNINGWHWEERNMLPWTRQRLQNLFEEAPVATECSEGTIKLIRVKDVSGEVCGATDVRCEATWNRK